MANVIFFQVTKFCLYFSFTVHYFFSKISSFTLVLSIRTVLDSFVCSFSVLRNSQLRLPFAVNLTLSFYSKSVICSEHTFDSSLKLLERVGAGERRGSEARRLSGP